MVYNANETATQQNANAVYGHLFLYIRVPITLQVYDTNCVGYFNAVLISLTCLMTIKIQ